MKLSELLREVEYKGSFDGSIEVKNITDDTRKITDSTLFVCIKHRHFDGHSAALAALKKGACAIVTQNYLGVKNEIVVKSTREAYAIICAEMNNHPERKLDMTAVTGTNAKTTVVSLLRQIYERAGQKCGSLGTVENLLGNKKEISNLTTQKPPELYKMLNEMLKNGCTRCIMEASSQALSQQRLYSINFDTAVFTNITPEHLDYHRSFEEYKQSKLMLFKNAKKAIINMDSPYSKEFIASSNEFVTYSARDDKADYMAKNISFKQSSVEYDIASRGRIFHIQYPSIGMFSVYNSMAAAAAAIENNVSIEDVQEALRNARHVEGRAEELGLNLPFKIYVDYAHTQDSLEQILKALRKICKNNLTVVFGCGGDRDKTKRPEMMKAACKYANTVIVTSDNPRGENPNSIIEDILSGRGESKCFVLIEADRRKAIAAAIKNAKRDDIILLAGKGHERYQIIGDKYLPFDERKEVEKILTEFPIFKGDET